MNPYAQRAADVHVAPFMRRPRTLVVAVALTFLLFVYTVHITHREDEEAVWIWMGMRSDGRCGREFGTDHISETKCGRGSPCCSAHGWCGSSEEYCSVQLGCQSGCWDENHPRERELRGGAMTPPREDVDSGEWDAEHNDSDWDGDDDYGGYDDDYEDYGDHNDYGEYGSRYPGYRGRRHRYGDYDYEDDEYEEYGMHRRDYDHEDDYEGEYHGYHGDEKDEESGIYHGEEQEAFDPVAEEGGDPLEAHDPAHAWTADEMLYHENEKGSEQGEEEEHPDELTDIS